MQNWHDAAQFSDALLDLVEQEELQGVVILLKRCANVSIALLGSITGGKKHVKGESEYGVVQVGRSNGTMFWILQGLN